jgi:hypothetical protein
MYEPIDVPADKTMSLPYPIDINREIITIL